MRILIVGPQSTHLFLWQRMYEAKGDKAEVVTIGSHDADLYKNRKKTNIHKVPLFSLVFFLISKPWLIIWGFKSARKEIHRYFAYKYYAKILRCEIDRFRPDVIHSHFLTSGAFITMETGFQPFFASIWGSDVYLNMEKKRNTKWLNDLSTKISFVHAQTNRQKMHLEPYGFSKENILVANWGVDIDISSEETVKNLLQKLHLTEDKKIILCPRRLDDNLNAKLLMSTAVDLVKVKPNLVFIFSSIGVYNEELMQLIDELGLTEQIKFPGFLPNEEFLALFAIATIYLQAPKSDGVALTLMNAMINKLPILTTDAGDVVENVHDGRTGIIIKPTIEDITEKINYLMTHPEIRKQLGQNAYKWAVFNCNREKNFQKVYNKIRKL